MKKAHQIKFFVQYIGKSEDHSIVEPYIIKKTFFSSLLYKLVDYKYSASEARKIKIKIFMPEMVDLLKKIKQYRPDIVILRDRNVVSLYVYNICRLLKIKCTIIYNQTPLYTYINGSPNNKWKEKIKKILINHFFPKVRMTTVYARDLTKLRENQGEYYIKEHHYFVPFVAEVNEEIANRSYCKAGRIRILSVGKYRDYKNHFLLIDAISLIKNRTNLDVTIIGQVASEEEKRYYHSLKAYIKKKQLDNIVNLETNIEYKKMNSIYQRNDVFVLTSKKEVASISILEAMANGMVTISTDANGTASYIKEGECGYLFRTMDAKDLSKKIEQLLSNQFQIKKMGRSAYMNIKDHYSFHNYYLALKQILKKEFKMDLDL